MVAVFMVVLWSVGISFVSVSGNLRVVDNASILLKFHYIMKKQLGGDSGKTTALGACL